jgi:general secretion pathway protein B
MSYILDALRKAERDHQVSRVPTLATTHGGVGLRRASWIWPLAGGVLAVGGLVAAYTLQWAPVPAIRRDPGGEVKPPVTSAVVASRPDPAVSAPLVVPAPERPPSPPANPPAKRPTAARSSAGSSATPSVSSTPPPPASSAARRAPTIPTLPGKADASAAPATKPPAPSVARSAASPPNDRDAIREPGTSDDALAPPATAAVTPSDGASSRTAPTAPARALPRLALDVLVYSEVPAERLVFINGRKYVEGQMVDEGAVIEQITPDGAILRHEGKQIVLRPKLNPYTRPTSP